MNDATRNETCPECGLPIPDHSGCPGCSLRLALSPEAASPPQVNPTVPGDLKSRYFADYEILGEIARGGMGVVYRARQLGINRHVALKMVQSAHLLSDEARLRFRMEIEAVAQLHHPNIVSLYESGEHDGAHFFTMRLIEGGDLSASIGLDHPLRERVQQLVKVCRAVHYAHQRGILHRDLKPSNILIDEQGEPHVADFGLAKSLDQDTGFTFTSSVLGSPNYMAPEQAAGKTRQLTTAVDVYGLGAILYHLLTGRPPFQAATPIDTLRQVVDQDPTPPRQLRSTVDRDLETIALKCLRKEPSGRYSTAEKLAEDLERWLAGLPILARPLGPFTAAWRWSRRRPALAALGVVTLLATVILLVTSNQSAHRLRLANDRAGRLVDQLQREKVESLLDSGETSHALALLTYLLEKAPQDLALGSRLVSALSLRSFALPWTKPGFTGSEIVAVGFCPDGASSLAVARNGSYRHLKVGTRETIEGVLRADGKPVLSALFRPAGETFATVHADGVRIWPLLPSSAPIALLPHDTTLRSTALSPTTQQLLTVDDRNQVRLWSPAEKAVPPGPWSAVRLETRDNDTVTTCAFHPSGNRCVLGYASGRVQIRSTADLSTEQEYQVLGQILVLEFDRSGRQLATATYAGLVDVRTLEAPEENAVQFAFSAGATDLEFSPDGRLLALAGWSHRGEAYVWDLALRRRVSEMITHSSHVTSVRFSPDGQQLVTLGDDATARCWNTRTWRLTREPLVHSSAVLQAAFSPDSTRLVTGSYTGAVWWEMAPPPGLPQILSHESAVTSAALSPDGTLAATATVNGSVHLWRIADTQLLRTSQPHRRRVYFVHFSPSARYLVTGDSDGPIHLSDVSPSADAGIVLGTTPCIGAAFSPDSSLLAAAGQDGSISVWELPKGELAFPPLQHGDGMLGAKFSSDGAWLATYGGPHGVRVWNVRTRGTQHAALFSGKNIQQIEFSTDSKRLVAGGRDLPSVLWDVQSGKERPFTVVNRSGATSLAFSPDGARLASACHDGTIEVVSLSDSAAAPRVITPSGRVTSLQFTPDGKWLCSVTLRGEARLWDPESSLPVSDPYQMQPSCSAASLSSDGTLLLSYGNSLQAGLWRLPHYAPGSAPELIGLAHRIGRKQFSPSGQLMISPVTAAFTNSQAQLRDALYSKTGSKPDASQK